jgi:sarcosine oxidase subunit gamma
MRDDAIGSTGLGHYGVAGTGVALAEATIAAAWNVQGDPARSPFVEEARRIFGVALPLAPNTSARRVGVAAHWLGPASWLLVGGTPSSFGGYTAARDALNAAGAALFDVSASRVAWSLSGPHATDVLAKGCPLDLHPRAFAAGACAQSVYLHVNVLIEKRDDTPTFAVMVARSFARDVWHALCEASAQYGYEVRAPAPFA